MKSWLPQTILARLTLSHVLVSLVSILLISLYAAGVLYSAVRAQVTHQFDDLGFACVNRLEPVLAAYHQGSATEEQLAAALQPLFAARPNVHYTVYLPDGSPVIDSSGNLPPRATQNTDADLWQALSSDLGTGSSTGNSDLHLAFRIEADSQTLGILRLSVPFSIALASARRSLVLLIATAVVMGLGMGAVGFFLARGLAGPIEAITLAAERLAGGEMNARVDASGQPQEIYRLAQAFNSMAGKIQMYVSEIREFVANASHELRTPLTSIKLRVEALRSGALEDPPVSERFLAEIESEVDRLSALVNDLLDLSLIESGLEAARRLPVDLGAIVAEVYETFSVRAERAGVALSYKVQPGLTPVLGNEDQLRRMLYNLVDNAIKYTSQRGSVELSLQASEAADRLLLKVSDTGFGIPATQLPHVFERFYRVEATRPRYGHSPGSGLGLPIAKSIAEAHGGRIGVNSQVGVGSVFWVELPVMKAK